MTTERFKELLGREAQSLTDQELENNLRSLSALADIFIEQMVVGDAQN